MGRRLDTTTRVGAPISGMNSGSEGRGCSPDNSSGTTLWNHLAIVGKMFWIDTPFPTHCVAPCGVGIGSPGERDSVTGVFHPPWSHAASGT